MLFPWIARHNSSFGLGRTTAAVTTRYESIRAGLVSRTRRGEYVTDPQVLDWAVLNSIYRDAEFMDAAETIVLAGREASRSATTSDRIQLRSLLTERVAGAPWPIRRAALANPNSSGPRAQSAGAASRRARPPWRPTPRPTSSAATTRRTRPPSPPTCDGPTRTPRDIRSSVTRTPCRRAPTGPYRRTGRTVDLTGTPRMLMF